MVAFGAQGFRRTRGHQRVPPPETCAPEPNTTLAGLLHLAAGVTNHLVALNAHDHNTVTFVDNVGPAGDKRRAVVPTGSYLNFGITDFYLGEPCIDPRTVKVCVDFYDDPAFAGLDVRFGPEAYATDDKGGIGFVPRGPSAGSLLERTDNGCGAPLGPSPPCASRV